METKRRSIAKAVSWRVVATLVTASVVYVVTGEGAVALEIGLIDTSIKMFGYFGHERLWLRIPYGQRKRMDYRI